MSPSGIRTGSAYAGASSSAMISAPRWRVSRSRCDSAASSRSSSSRLTASSRRPDRSRARRGPPGWAGCPAEPARGPGCPPGRDWTPARPARGRGRGRRGRTRRRGRGVPRLHHGLDLEVRAEHDHQGLPQHVLAAAAAEAVPGAGVGHGQQQGVAPQLGDLGVLAEQDPGEPPLALDLLQHLRPEAADVGHGELGPRRRRGRVGLRAQLGVVGLAAGRTAGVGHRRDGAGRRLGGGGAG